MLSDEIIKRMPKTEVHLHLEGTTSPETLWAMAERNRVSLPAATLEELRALYAFESFDRFIELWLAKCSCLKSRQDFEQMADGFVTECRRQNVRYVEAHFTPYDHERYGLGGERALDIVTRRLQAAEAAGGPVTRLILDIPAETLARDEMGLSDAQLWELNTNGLRYGLAEMGLRRRLLQEFEAEGRELGILVE